LLVKSICHPQACQRRTLERPPPVHLLAPVHRGPIPAMPSPWPNKPHGERRLAAGMPMLTPEIKASILQTDGKTDRPSRNPAQQPHDANSIPSTPTPTLPSTADTSQLHLRGSLASMHPALTPIHRSFSNSRQETVAVGLILLLR